MELPSDTVIDGEVVALDESGKASFDILRAIGREALEIVFYTFDLVTARSNG